MRRSKKIKSRCVNYQIEGNNIENDCYVLDLVNIWINNADSKVGVFCALYSIMFAAIAFIGEKIISKQIDYAIKMSLNINICAEYSAIALLVIGFVGFLVSVCICFLIIVPKLTSQCGINAVPYSIFYGDIAQFSNCDEYIKVATTATKNDFRTEVLKEVFYNSKICVDKMKWFKRGIMAAGGSVFWEIIGEVLLWWAYKG